MTIQIQGVEDANGQRWVYRRISSVLECRRWSSSVWYRVTGDDFEKMTPTQLRHVADVLERPAAPEERPK